MKDVFDIITYNTVTEIETSMDMIFAYQAKENTAKDEFKASILYETLISYLPAAQSATFATTNQLDEINIIHINILV